MNIDLLFTAKGEAGLLGSDLFPQKIAGVVFHKSSRMLVLEYADMDYLDLNIPVEPEYFEALDYCQTIQIGSFKNDHIAQAYQTTFMIAEDPYREAAMGKAEKSDKQLLAFEYFIKACLYGQPVYRDDLGDESSMGCVLGDAVPSSLQFAPHLARQRNFEVAPTFTPNAPGMGLGGSGGGSAQQTQQSRKDGEEE